MVDLRLEGTDGEFLILETADGVTHRLLIDESLRRAVKRESVSEDDSQKISPREIQLEVRAGVTIEELAQQTGASLAYIEKFAAPVIDELAHIVASALAVRITMAGDRYSETTQVEFGEVIANRLASQGVVQPFWSSRKTENNGWQIHCRFGDNQASWAFDPRKLLLSPENELAVQLGAAGTLGEAAVPKLRPVSMPVSAPVAAAPAETATPAAPTASPVSLVTPPVFTSVPSPAPVAIEEDATEVSTPSVSAVPTPLIPRSVEPVSPIKPVIGSITEDLGRTAEFDGVVPFGRESSEPAPASADASDLTNTADLLDALRKRRIERERDVISTNTGSMAIIPDAESADLANVVAEEDISQDPEDVFDSETPTAQIEVQAPAEEPEKPKARPRTSMPSWDEIVFNTRSDD